MHFGVVTPPVPGHIHPFGALGRELIRRGHRVTVFHMADLASQVIAEGLDFVAIGATDHPPGTLPASLGALAQRHGLAAIHFTVRAVSKTSEMVLRDAPEAMRKARVEALLVDQMEPAGSTVAERLQLPFVTVCNALLLNEEPDVPPPFTPWNAGTAPWIRLRNQAGYLLGRRTMRPVTDVVGSYRKMWNLPAWRHPEESFSKRAQISQQTPAFDFPRTRLGSNFYYVGPLRGDNSLPLRFPFPWERLDGRPLVYASLGTLQNRRANLFRIFAQACHEAGLQLALTHGGGLTAEETQEFPGNPIVVPYAPQRELLARAKLTLTHAGLNTVLDSLSFGVPLLAIPITYEQPAIASRVRWSGAGETLALGRVAVARVRALLERVLGESSYRRNAGRIQESIQSAGGVRRAADIVEQAVAQ